jgi:phosphatidylserine decarboxylase
MIIAKHGIPWVLGALILVLVSYFFNNWPGVYFWVLFCCLTIPLIILTIFFIYFFRDPERNPDSGYKQGLSVLSPADGALCAVEEEDGHLALYIEMHASNVHVTRAHIAGTVKKVTRASGKHYPVYVIKKTVGSQSRAILKNARVIIDMEDEEGRPFFYQLICGVMARRAIPYVKAGDVLKAGQRMGIIEFGSMTKVTLPDTQYRMIAQIKGNVFAGKTILCERME